MGLTSTQALAVASRAVPVALGRAATPEELWTVLAVARHETGYGGGWTSPPHAYDMVSSHNWGAIQCTTHTDRTRYLGITDAGSDGRAAAVATVGELGVPSAVPGHCAMAVDYSPSRGWYVHPYRTYPTDDEGCAALARLLEAKGVLEVARSTPDTYAIADAMYRAGYYQGTTTDPSRAIAAYARGLAEAVAGIEDRAGLRSPLTTTEGGGAPAGGVTPFRLGARDRRLLRARLAAELAERTAPRSYLRGQDVATLQRDLNSRPTCAVRLVEDGILGPLTLVTWLLDEPPPEEP
jgi:hypothetical protein